MAGWRGEKLGWPGPPSVVEQLRTGRVLAECGAYMGVKSRVNGFRSKIRGTIAKNDGVGDFYESRSFEYRKLSIQQFRCEPILIFEFTIRVECLAVREAGIWRSPPISRR
jgi:hypothetical protein